MNVYILFKTIMFCVQFMLDSIVFFYTSVVMSVGWLVAIVAALCGSASSKPQLLFFWAFFSEYFIQFMGFPYTVDPCYS